MLDIKFIRENPKEVQEGAEDKGIKIDINQILDSDKKYRKLSELIQKLREERNKTAEKKDIEKGKEIKEKLDKQKQELRLAKEALDDLLLKIPNLPLKDVPVGNESKNKIIKKVGTPKKFDFKPCDHLEIGETLDIIDVKRAVKVSGTRFGFLKNEAVLLEFALVQFVLEKLLKENFIPVIPPVLIKNEITKALGYWQAGGNENYYFLRDYELEEDGKAKSLNLYLAGTGEHVAVPMHKDEVFKSNELPKRYIVFSSCFRREAGSYGKDTRGIFRVHEFDKLEMISFVTPEDDEKERKKLLQFAEELVNQLGLSYQLVRLATRDMSFPAAETIDIEIWVPSQNKYRETHSISTTTDFQARRLNIRYLPAGKAGQEGNEKNYVHILNGTALAIGRTIIAILENYQQKDGSVEIPKVLQKYLPAGRQVIEKTSIKPKK
ncbi:MAG: serine--tRNA ligase [Candidatus Levybacteria bacterium RIFCSPLOWO2_01_FULL_38_21]|nr:MAG: serine--tRNA ligase [Candidatus Levybacteria bacterium RIFCSPLOWO2_01_FULL_38_21]